MKSGIKKTLLSTLALVLTVMMITGLAEVVEMSGGPALSVSVLASAGDPEPAPSGGGGGGGSSYSPSYSSSSSSHHTSKAKSTSVNKKANTIVVEGKTASLSASNLAAQSTTIKRENVLSVKKAKGTVTYKKVKGNKKIKVNKKTGNITVKKGLKRGTYKVRIKVRASGTGRYKAKSSTRTVVVKVDGVANTLTAEGKSVEIGQGDLNSANVVIKRADALNVSNPIGTVTYVKTGGNDAFSIDANTGDITVKKGTAEGKYQIQVKVKAAGNSVYYGKHINTAVVVTVKAAETPESDTAQPASDDSTAVTGNDNTAAPEESTEINETGGTEESGAAENQEP